MSQAAHLVKMANQIALNLAAAGSDEEAIELTARHIRQFWTPVMTRKLLDYAASGGEGCSPLVMRVLQERLQTQA